MGKSDRRALIFFHSGSRTVRSIKGTKLIIEFLESKGFKPGEIGIVDLMHEHALAAFIVEQAKGKREYPQLYLGDYRVGTYEEFKVKEETKELKKILKKSTLPSSLDLNRTQNEEPKDTKKTKGIFSQFGTVTTYLTATEWVVRGTIKGRWEHLPYLDESNANSGSNNNAPEKTKLNENPTSKYFDVEVVRTNWYWRPQKRVFRFYEEKNDGFARLEPITYEFKARFSYGDVEQVIMDDEHSLVIKFKNTADAQNLETLGTDIIVETILRMEPDAQLIKKF